MPIIRVELLEGRSQAVKQSVASEITQVVARHLGSDPAHIFVIFSDVAKSDWAVAGEFFAPPVPPPSTAP